MKIGVIGAGHLGKIHIKCIKAIPAYNLVGFYDTDPANAQKVAEEHNIPCFSSVDELIDSVDVVDVVTPTPSHYDCAVQALRKGKHVFIEKPVTATVEEARKLCRLATETNVKVQIGHVERFNPAFLAAKDLIETPMFIEIHRLALFNPRGNDVPVVLDLMIHDIDIVMSLVKSDIYKISASGVPIVCDTPDICNARIEFNNGCVANLTTNRLSMKNMRKVRIFQNNAYISMDLLDKNVEIIRLKNPDTPPNPFAMLIDTGTSQKEVRIEKPEVPVVNSIQMELEAFYTAITQNQTPIVSIYDGLKAVEVAHMIMDKISYPMTK